jgi:predicted O-methyltransferase YrrM
VGRIGAPLSRHMTPTRKQFVQGGDLPEHHNRIKAALPLYGSASPTFLKNWLAFQAQLAQYDKYAGLVLIEQAPVDLAMNEMIKEALKDPKWDYLFVVEHDMVLPPGVVAKVGALDPATHPIYSCLYFGRAQDNQAPIPGYWINERLHRLNYEQVCTMLPQRGGVAGLHKVDTVGMGATAIHRSVFEKWPYSSSHPWFRFDYDHMGPIGHDVWFCVQAGRQGYPIYVDSSMIAHHIGEWRSTDVSYLATTEYARNAQVAVRGWSPPPTAMTANELTYLSQLASCNRVLEVGSQFGNSTVAMARTAASVVAVDWFGGDEDAGAMDAATARSIYFGHLDQMGVADKVTTIAARWEDALPALVGGFDLIFLDAAHSEEATRDLLAASAPLLTVHGLIAFHDYGRFGVKPVVDGVQDDDCCDLVVVDTLAVLGDDIPPPDLAPRVVIPYVAGSLRKETTQALRGVDAERVPLKGDTAYYDLISERWRSAHSFITIEQDIVPTPSQLDELIACGEEWCAFEYEYPPFGLYAGMGLAKFSAALLLAEPKALEITGTLQDVKHPPKHWCRVDGYLKQYLADRGHTQHIHGQVKHLHNGRPAHDCTTPEEAAAIIAAQTPTH